MKSKIGVILKTCNREEFYEDNFINQEIVTHLFRVACGLDSPLLGETAIQGQVKIAYQTAAASFTLSKNTHILFQNALRVSKKVRSLTRISQGAMSYGQAVVEILKMKKIDFSRTNFTLIGIHNLAENILKYLARGGARTIFLANRTWPKAQAKAAEFNCLALKLEELQTALASTDVLISATSAPHYIVKTEVLPPNRNLLIFDLATPADIDPKVKTWEKIQLLNLRDIEQLVDQNLSKRRQALSQAEVIIENEVVKFCNLVDIACSK